MFARRKPHCIKLWRYSFTQQLNRLWRFLPSLSQSHRPTTFCNPEKVDKHEFNASDFSWCVARVQYAIKNLRAFSSSVDSCLHGIHWGRKLFFSSVWGSSWKPFLWEEIITSAYYIGKPIAVFISLDDMSCVLDTDNLIDELKSKTLMVATFALDIRKIIPNVHLENHSGSLTISQHSAFYHVPLETGWPVGRKANYVSFNHFQTPRTRWLLGLDLYNFLLSFLISSYLNI